MQANVLYNNETAGSANFPPFLTNQPPFTEVGIMAKKSIPSGQSKSQPAKVFTNNYTINGDVVFVEAKRGCTGELFIFQCDLSDLELLKQRSWNVHDRSISIYANRRINGKSTKISLQKHLTESKFIEFLNGDKLDFRRCNINPLDRQKRNIKFGCKIKGNRIDVHGDTATVWAKEPGGTMRAFLIDLDMLDFVKKYTWSIKDTGYPVARKSLGNGKVKRILLHRHVIGANPGQRVDHINRIKFDARRENLRICSDGQNKHNMGLRRNNKSGFTGVDSVKNGRWRAAIRIKGVYFRKHFPTKYQAAHQILQWKKEFNPSGLKNG